MVAPSPSVAGTVPVMSSIRTLAGLMFRGLLTRGRMFALGAIAAVALLLAVLARFADDPEAAAVTSIAEFGIGILLPLATLLFAAPLWGELVEDRLLVYLWSKPIPYWHLALAGMVTVAAVVLPVVVLSLAVATMIGAQVGLLGPVVLAAALGVMTYGAIHLWLGLRFTWGLWIGLVYLVLWENVLARLGDGPARFSVRSWLLTIVRWGTDEPIDLADRDDTLAVVVPVVVCVAMVGLTVFTLRRRDID